MEWTKARPELTFFNGMTQSAAVGPMDIGLFKEKYPINGERWAIRYRRPGQCWGHAMPFHTKRDALAFVEEHHGEA